MSKPGPPLPLRIYVAALAAGTVAAAAVAFDSGFTPHAGPALFLIIMFGLAESLDLFFHHERGRISLSPSEALFLPMVVALTPFQMIIGVAVAMAIVKSFHLREGWLKWTFNVSNYSVAAALGVGLWQILSEPTNALTPRNAVVAALCVIVFALTTHLFVAAAISLAERRSIFPLLREVIPPASWSLAGSVSMGLLFAAAYLAATWTVVLFALPIAGLVIGYRAVIRQSREKERVESLHAASRALAVAASLEDSIAGFLTALCEIASAAEARAVVKTPRGPVESKVRDGQVVASMAPLGEGALTGLLHRFQEDQQPIIVNQSTQDRSLVDELGALSLVGVPLVDDDEVVGCIIALDRVGAEEFGESDATLMEALAHELVLTLDSYRLFEQIAEERERFRQIFAGSKEGICLLDEEGVIKAWNPALARITGFDEEDILGEKWSERVLVRDRYHRRIEGMDIVTVPPDEELELVTRQGPPRWVAIMSGEVQAEDTKSWVVLVRDITREHELEESKSDFLSTISHELRTPLTTIKGSLQVMSRPNASANSEIGKQMIEIMKRGSDRLERLVMNLLAVSQMEAGDVQIYPDEIELEDLVRSRIGSILVDHPQVEVSAPEEVVVRADRERLSQAVEHILDNARKFGPESGLIQVNIAKENGFARLSISDQGPGIPKIDQDRIFDRFVRLGHVLTRETQGPGVGLFIAKRSIEAMGGSIEVESEPNRGATFHVRIPLARPMAAIEPSTA